MKAYRRDIDGLRALAVLPVVFEHAGIPGFPGGFIGVDIFFVISGFLITGILADEMEQGRFSILRFYERRARRILPALFALLTVCTVAGYFWFPPWQYDALARSAIATTLFVSNFWFARTTGGYFGDDANYEPLLHTWSLAVEEQFYIAFPIMLWLLFRVDKRWIKPALIAICTISFAASLWATQVRPVANFFMAPTRAWELGLGALLALGAAPKCSRPDVVQVVALAGLAAIIAAIIGFDDETPFPGLAAILPCLGAAALLWAGGQDGETLVARLLKTRVMVAVGLISYSLYLWHWPPLVMARGFSGAANPGWIWTLAAIIFSIIMAWASWRFVERPFRQGEAKGGLTRRAVFTSTAAGGLAILAVFSAIAGSNGLEQRASPRSMVAYRQAVPQQDSKSALGGQCLSADDPGQCRLGKTAEPGESRTFLVWGDSHAAVLLHGFDAWARTKGISGAGAVKLGCPPLMGVDRADLEPRRRCAAYSRSVMEFVVRNPQIRQIVLASRWALIAEGSRSPGEAGARAVLMTEQGYSMNKSDNLALFERGLARTISELRALGREVVIVEVVPEVGFNVPKTYIGQQFYGTTMPDGPTTAALAARTARTNALLERLAAQYSATIIRLAPLMCTPDCAVMHEGHLLYSDDDHLSQFAAKWLVPLAMAELEPTAYPRGRFPHPQAR